MPTVLIIEDNEAMAVALHDGFSYEGYEVRQAADGVTGLKLMSETECDLVILDIMLPRLSGLDVCKRARRDGNKVPIIMLTARGQEIDKVLGLKVGADDYLTKPFSFLELMARVEAVMRRCSSQVMPAGRYEFGDVELDFDRSEARKAGTPLALSPREFKLLRFLIDHRGEVLPRERLLSAVWDYEEAPFTRTVDMHISKLRKKIEDEPGNPVFIITVPRSGYKFTG